MTQPDILLIQPGGRGEIYQNLDQVSLIAKETPIWLLMIAFALRAKGYAVEALDADVLGLGPRAVAERVASVDPKLSCVVVYGHQPSASTQMMGAAGDIAREIKARGANQLVAFVGGHVAALSQRTMLDEAVDFVAQGEGLHTLDGLLGHLRDRAAAALEDVPGLWYRDPIMGIKSNPPANMSREIDEEYPGFAWDLVPMELYRAHNWHCFGDDKIQARTPYASMYTTLGCPYRCTFCCINAPFRLTPDRPNSYRFHSPEFVVRELEQLQERYGVYNLKIADEMFVLNERHLRGIAEGIKARGLKFNIWAYARVDTVKDGFLPLLKDMGVNWLALGIESASKHVRDGVEKGRFGAEQITDVVRSIKAADINIIGNYIFGLPDDTLDSMQETLDLALDLKCEFANFYSAMAYPGSQLYVDALEHGWALPTSWTGFSQHAFETLPLPTEHVPAGEVLAFRDQAFQIYFTDPGYLAYVRSRFGPKTEAHIREMTQQPLPRKFAVTPRVSARPLSLVA